MLANLSCKRLRGSPVINIHSQALELIVPVDGVGGVCDLSSCRLTNPGSESSYEKKQSKRRLCQACQRI